MTPDLAKRLALVFPSAAIQETGVTGVTGVAGVADVTRYAQNPQQIRQLRLLRLEGYNAGKMTIEGVAGHVPPPAALHIETIEEAAVLAGGETRSAAEDREEASTNPQIVGLPLDERRKVVRWINNHFQSSPLGRCAHCGGDRSPDDPFVAIFCGTDRAELHAGCYPAWVALQESEAHAALGIDPPDNGSRHAD